MVPNKKTVSKEQALLRLTTLCAGTEKCLADIRKKLKDWDLNSEDTESVIQYLLQNKYVDESRYAKAFVNDKVKFSGWGRNKVFYALKAKAIPEEFINEALADVPDEDFSEGMETVMRAKFRSLKYKDRFDAKNKLLRFGASRGFEFDALMSLVDKLVSEIE